MKFPVSACLVATLALASCNYSEEKPQSEIQASSDNPSQSVNEETIQASNNKELLSELRAGGYVIYMRHATTEKDYADQADPSMRLSDCSSQRKLSLQGVKEAQGIGLAIKEQDIPIGKVITSDYCRAWKTANLAFGYHDYRDSRLNFLPYEDYTDDLNQLMKKNLTPLLTDMPNDGTNTFIVGHDDLFEATTGIYPEPQGIAYIVKPESDQTFTLITSLLPSQWKDLK
tara:strand:+ start:198 stop:884 length:687 start_codon:yes stop_codon:yes gene_type:complete